MVKVVASPQGYPAVVELSPTILGNILQAMIHAAFPPGQTFADPRPGRGPYSLLPGIRLTLAPPERPRPHARPGHATTDLSPTLATEESALAAEGSPAQGSRTSRTSAGEPLDIDAADDDRAKSGAASSDAAENDATECDATESDAACSDAATVGAVATLQDIATGQTGSYAIYFEVRPGRGELSLHVAFIDPAGSQPIDHLPPKLLHLALAGRGPIPWRLGHDAYAIMRTSSEDPGRAVLFLATAPLDSAIGRAAEPSSPPRGRHPALPSMLLRRPSSGEKTQDRGPVQVLHREDWAALIDAPVVRALLEEALSSLGVIQAEGARVQVERIAIPRLIAGGLEVELEARVDGQACSARGPLYIGYTLERASSDVPQLRTSVNASKLQVSGTDALPALLYPLTAILPQLFLLVLPGIPATLESWVYGASGRGLARATDHGTIGPIASLVGELLQPLPPELATIVDRPMLVRLDLSPRGLTLGIAYRPPPRSGVTKTPLEVPLRITTVGPASILLGWLRAGDRPRPPSKDDSDDRLDDKLDDKLDVTAGDNKADDTSGDNKLDDNPEATRDDICDDTRGHRDTRDNARDDLSDLPDQTPDQTRDDMLDDARDHTDLPDEKHDEVRDQRPIAARDDTLDEARDRPDHARDHTRDHELPASIPSQSRSTASTSLAPALTVAGFAPLRPPQSIPSSANLYVSGHALDGVISAHLISGFHRRTLTIARQTARLLVLHADLREMPTGLWDLECEWSGALTNGVVYGDRLTFRNQLRTYIAAPERRADDRPLRVLTYDGEPLLLQLANGLLTPLGDLPSLSERLREAPAVDVDVVEVEVPLTPPVGEPRPLAVEHVADDHFVIDAGEYGRLRVRTLAVKSDAAALAEVEALLRGLPHYELV